MSKEYVSLFNRHDTLDLENEDCVFCRERQEKPWWYIALTAACAAIVVVAFAVFLWLLSIHS